MTVSMHCIAAGAALALALGAPARAAEPALSELERESALKQIREQHRAASDRCATMGGYDQEVCLAEADGRRDVAEARLRLRRDNTGENLRHLARMQANAQYRVETARCYDREGDTRTACLHQAESNFGRAMALIQQDQELSSAVGSGRRW